MSNAYGATVKKIRATLPDGAEKIVSNPSLGGDGYYTLAFSDPIDTSGKNLTATFYVTDSRGNETKYLTDPFEVLDQEGVGQLVEMGTKKGRSTKPELKVGICGEHGGEPSSVKFCTKLGMNYVSCSPFRVPIARVAAAQASVEE